MPRWLSLVVRRVRELAVVRRISFTLKAQRELQALGLGLDVGDACDVLARLTPEDSTGRVLSEVTSEWMYVFRPRLVGKLVYVKLILRSDCLVVSFHEDEGTSHEEES